MYLKCGRLARFGLTTPTIPLGQTSRFGQASQAAPIQPTRPSRQPPDTHTPSPPPWLTSLVNQTRQTRQTCFTVRDSGTSPNDAGRAIMRNTQRHERKDTKFIVIHCLFTVFSRFLLFSRFSMDPTSNSGLAGPTPPNLWICRNALDSSGKA